MFHPCTTKINISAKMHVIEKEKYVIRPCFKQLEKSAGRSQKVAPHPSMGISGVGTRGARGAIAPPPII